MSLVELEASCDFACVGVLASAQIAHPSPRPRNRNNEGVISSPGRTVTPARDNDLLAGTRASRRQRQGMSVCLGIFLAQLRGTRACDLADDLQLILHDKDPPYIVQHRTAGLCAPAC